MKVVLVASIFFLVVIAYAQQPPQPSPLDVLQQELTNAYEQALQIVATYQNLSQEEIAKTGRPGHFSKLGMEMAEDFFETVHDIKEITADYQAELPPTPPNNTNIPPYPLPPQPEQEMQKINQQVNDTLEQVKLTLDEVRSTLDQIQKERAELQLNKNQKGQNLMNKAKQYQPNPYAPVQYPDVNQQPQDPNIKNNPYYAEQQADMLSDMVEYQQDMAEAAYERAVYQDYLNRMNPQAQTQAQPQAQPQVLKQQQQTEAQLEAAEDRLEAQQEAQEAAAEAQQAAAEAQQTGSQQASAGQVQILKITTLAKVQQPTPQQPEMSQEIANEAALEMQEAQQEQAADMAELRAEQYELAAEAAAAKQLSNPPQRSKTSTLQIVINISLAVIVLGIAILILAKRNQTFDKKKSVLITKKYKNEEYTQINV